MLQFLFNYKYKIARDYLNYINFGDQLKRQKKKQKIYLHKMKNFKIYILHATYNLMCIFLKI